MKPDKQERARALLLELDDLFSDTPEAPAATPAAETPAPAADVGGAAEKAAVVTAVPWQGPADGAPAVTTFINQFLLKEAKEKTHV